MQHRLITEPEDNKFFSKKFIREAVTPNDLEEIKRNYSTLKNEDDQQYFLRSRYPSTNVKDKQNLNLNKEKFQA